MARLRSEWYSIQKFKSATLIESPDSTLFSKGVYSTTLKPSDLPPFYIYGRFYKRFGFLSSKGVRAVSFKSFPYTNSFLKDSCLTVTYESGTSHRVYGGNILSILSGIRQYSPEVDIQPVLSQIKEEQKRLKRKYPEDVQRYQVDVDERVKGEPWRPERYQYQGGSK